MGDLVINFDLAGIANLASSIEDLQEKLVKGVEGLTYTTLNHIQEEAQQRLHARRDMFLQHLHVQQESPHLWSIVVDEAALWIEDGQSAFDMLPGLLGSPKAKVSADGNRYMVVPFKHNKGPTQQTPAGQNLTATIKQELKSRKIPYQKIERDAHGIPKQGLLHRLDITNGPLKQGSGKGQGHGPAGAVMQGSTGIPFLKGVAIYQHIMLNKDGTVKTNAKGQAMASRDIMTFRIASEKHPEKWKHPGNEAMRFLDSAYDWAVGVWERDILPGILAGLAAQ